MIKNVLKFVFVTLLIVTTSCSNDDDGTTATTKNLALNVSGLEDLGAEGVAAAVPVSPAGSIDNTNLVAAANKVASTLKVCPVAILVKVPVLTGGSAFTINHPS